MNLNSLDACMAAVRQASVTLFTLRWRDRAAVVGTRAAAAQMRALGFDLETALIVLGRKG